MTTHEKKIEIMKKYAKNNMFTGFNFHIKGEIPSKKIDNAIKKFAFGLDRTTIIGFYDTTVLGSGKEGYIFTDDKIYYLDMLEKPKKLWYSDIKKMERNIYSRNNDKLEISLYDGSTVYIESSFLDKLKLKWFLEEIIKVDNDHDMNGGNINIERTSKNHFGSTAGGYAAGAYKQVNNSYEEEKFHANQGHGFAAERANNLFDKMTGHDAHIVGDDNAKNGADRVVDGIYIQSKYYQTGSGCVNACFEEDGKGMFRYMHDGSPMQIEVPSDKYDAAINAMKEKIRNGQVRGVTNPEDASKIIKKGHFTYDQAKNIAKSGTVESLTYDAVNGAVIASTAFGITALLTFATSLWSGEDFGSAVKLSVYSGLKVGGTAFVVNIIAGQLSKAGLNSALVGGSEAIVAVMGPKASAVLINAFRNGSNIYGAAAMKSAAKLLRGNAITAGVTVLVLSAFDIANIFSGRISGKQLFKNLTNTVATVGGGTLGWMGGAAIGTSILPGVGTVIGGLVGSVVAGGASGKATNAVVGVFIEDDAEEMVRIIEEVFGEMAVEYLLSKKEAEKSVDRLRDELEGKMLKDMFASSDRREYARDLLQPIIEREVSKRRHVEAPSIDQMTIALREVLEDISDYSDQL